MYDENDKFIADLLQQSTAAGVGMKIRKTLRKSFFRPLIVSASALAGNSKELVDPMRSQFPDCVQPPAHRLRNVFLPVQGRDLLRHFLAPFPVHVGDHGYVDDSY